MNLLIVVYIVNGKLVHFLIVLRIGVLCGAILLLNGYLRKYARGTGNVLPQHVESFMMHQASNSATTPKENNEETISFIKYLNKSHHPEKVKKMQAS